MSSHDQVASIAEINPVEPDSHGGRPHHWGPSVHFAGARATSLFDGRRCLSVAVCGGIGHSDTRILCPEWWRVARGPQGLWITMLKNGRRACDVRLPPERLYCLLKN